MAESRAAIRYAKAIIDIAQGNNNSDKVLADMDTIVAAVKESKELKLFLESPIVKGKTKESALVEIFVNAQPETKALFQLLKDNKRFEILVSIANQYEVLYNEVNGIENAVVTTAVPLDADLEGKVLAKVATFSSKKVNITNIVDPAIIGGFVLRIGDKQYNASVANRLLQLKREFSN